MPHAYIQKDACNFNSLQCIKLLFLSGMGINKWIKQKAGKFLLIKELETHRNRRGSNFEKATSVGIIYRDTDEQMYLFVKQYLRHLRDNHGIKMLRAMAFVNGKEKHIPRWQAHKLELDYYTPADLSWRLSPSVHLRQFASEEFNVLIDLSDKWSVELEWLVNHSKAQMKVGRQGSLNEKYYDMLFNLGNDKPLDKFVTQIDYYLSNFNIR